MLVITRRPGQGKSSIINIGNDIKVVVIEVTGKQVKLGIDAPPDIGIWRSEIPKRGEIDGNRR